MANTKSNTTEKKELPKFNDSGTTFFSKTMNIIEYIYKIAAFYIITNKTEFGFILGLITYIIII